MNNSVIILLVTGLVAVVAAVVWRYLQNQPSPPQPDHDEVKAPPNIQKSVSPPTDDFLAAQLSEMRSRTHFFDVPDSSFNPLSASREDLEHFGLPSLPAADDPLLRKKYLFWQKMYSPPLEFVQTEFMLPLGTQYLRSDALRFISTPARVETSRNWSGAYISPRDGRMLVEVYGEWKVPPIKFPDVTLAVVPERRSSTWIGLDGQRRYFDSSLPQVGTEQFIATVGDSEQHTRGCFFQWWLREEDPPKPQVPLLVAVSDNDHMMAAIWVMDSTHVRFYLKNQNTGAFLSVWGVESPKADLPSSPPLVNVRISGATAEWVMERPTVWGSDELWELPEYATVNFENCFAVSAPEPGGDERDESLVGARLINMQRVSENPHRMVTISDANWLSEESIETVYVEET